MRSRVQDRIDGLVPLGVQARILLAHALTPSNCANVRFFPLGRCQVDEQWVARWYTSAEVRYRAETALRNLCFPS